MIELNKSTISINLLNLGLRNLNRIALFESIDEAQSDIRGDAWTSDLAKLTAGSGVALTAGYVSWLLRGGALLSALMSSFTVWQAYDPVFVLLGKKRKDDKAEEKLSDADRLFMQAKNISHQSQGVAR